MTLDLEANEVEVKVLTSLASVAESTEFRAGARSEFFFPIIKDFKYKLLHEYLFL
jgi:hypothetical protein